MPTHTLPPGSTSAAAKNKQEKTKMLCWQKTDRTLFFVMLVNIKKQATFRSQYKSPTARVVGEAPTTQAGGVLPCRLPWLHKSSWAQLRQG